MKCPLIVFLLVISIYANLLAQDAKPSEENVNQNSLKIETGTQVSQMIKEDSLRIYLDDARKRAVLRSLLIPGWGQIYNAKQWRDRRELMHANGIVQPKLWWLSVPVIYGGFVGSIIAYNYNQDNYKWILGEVQYRLANNDMTLDEELEAAPTDYLIEYKDRFRRDRDLSILIGIGVYAINVLEAYVSGTFFRYDIQDVLTLRFTPNMEYVTGVNSIGNHSVMGIRLTILIR